MNIDFSAHANNNFSHNQHEFLAQLRRQIERGVVGSLAEFVSVGSTQNRELAYTARVHMMSPSVIESDNIHHIRFSHSNGTWQQLTADPLGYYICLGNCPA
jgi:hypothetical protein